MQRQTLRAIALELGARNPGLGAEAYIQLIRARADNAAAAQKTLAGLQRTIESLDLGGERIRALAILQQAQTAFESGRLEEAEAGFAELSFLRRSELDPARKAWAEAADLQADSAALRGDTEAADRIRLEKVAALVRLQQDFGREQWRTELARAGDWYDSGVRLGKNQDLLRAIRIYRDAVLPLAPRERVPMDWAATQNNLGNALTALGERESGTARLEEAVRAFRSALGEYTRERVPLQWAMTQNNLGALLWTLGERESGTARLEEAVQAFRAALAER
ncbi:MAG TPA: tetratricopeptide repeat protein, partial [Rubrivivax sp.]|nr:tetratricopeptide repeat protein [Rubrivivax sp.]